MRAYIIYPVTILVLLTLILGSCVSTKKLKENESLITKLEIKGVDKKFSEQAFSYTSLDIRPNSAFNLWIYNTFNKKGKKNLGEAPRILDSNLVEVSRGQIQKFLHTKGYLNAKVESEIVVTKKKRSEITFKANTGEEFKFRDISFDIKDSLIKKLYLGNRASLTKMSKGGRLDEDSIAYERDQIYHLMRKNGYYEFVRPHVRASIDTNLNNNQADIEIQILNPGDSSHQRYTFGNTFIRIQPSNGVITDIIPDTSTVNSQYKFFDYSGSFKSDKLANYLFLNKGELYDIDNVELTTQRLFELNVFKSVSVDFRKRRDTSTNLIGIINVIPLKKKSNRLDGEYNFNFSVTGVNAGLTYQNRNFFGGAEVFEVKLRGGFQFDKSLGGSLSDRLLSRDYQVGASLSFPRLITPFKFPSVIQNGVPRTRISTNYQNYQLTDRYVRKVLGTTYSYEWTETKSKLHSFTPINIQYAQGLINPNVEDDLIAQGNAFFLVTLSSQLVSSSIYTYSYNLAKLNENSNKANFFHFNGNIEIGGNSASLISKLDKENKALDEKLILGVPYYQFIKTEGDFRFYRSLGIDNRLVFRFNPGIGYSYGNVKSMPFDKMFFGGGSNGIRAWQARTLGPGNYNRASLGSDTTRLNLRNIDQLGDLKFEGNIEYRFKLLDNFFGAKLKGAAFLDFGNVWQLRDNSLHAGGQFKLNKLWSQTAIGTGFGLRFDVSFFVFRLDAGLKLKDPQFIGSDQWIGKYYFDREAKKEFKNRYAITNNPDRYSTTQIQFGIGMPF